MEESNNQPCVLIRLFPLRVEMGKTQLKFPSTYNFPANINASPVPQEPLSKKANNEKQTNCIVINFQGSLSQQTVKHIVALLLSKAI